MTSCYDIELCAPILELSNSKHMQLYYQHFEAETLVL